MELEKNWAPQQDEKHLARLLDTYTRVFSSMPGSHCENESYARMLVRFAELKAWVDQALRSLLLLFIKQCVSLLCCPDLNKLLTDELIDSFALFSSSRNQDINEAEGNFSVASLQCPDFAFVHVAQAQFEHSQGRQ